MNYLVFDKIAKKFKESKKDKKETFIQSVLNDIQQNHNHSWYDEIYLRNKNNLDDIALIYRGYKITYEEMFAKIKEYAKALKAVGVKKGDEIPVCISNTPELVYILGAISMIGGKINIFSAEFEYSYIDEIIKGCNSPIMFIEDNLYDSLKEILELNQDKKIVITSLNSSLKNGIDPYKELEGKYCDLFTDKTSECLNEQSLSLDSFLSMGKSYFGHIKENTGLDDEFSITYSSGSTNSKRAKAIVHTTRSFITIGRCHDTDVQKSASMKKFTIQAHIPSYSNTDIISSISDALMQGSKLAMEPIYDNDFFINSLLINKPNYVVATRCAWITTAKKVLYDLNYKGVKFPFLLIPFSVGEPTTLGEEKFMNKALRKAKAGIELTKTPFSPITMSMAGGDCEHGGIFWTLFRQMKSEFLGKKTMDGEVGLGLFEMVDVVVLDEKGNILPPNTIGRLVANSPCNMKCYKNNDEATNNFFVRDASGKVWGDLSVHGFVDEYHRVHMKGRILRKGQVPLFQISDIILRDTKNVMSCEIVPDFNGQDECYIAHIEFQPDRKRGISNILNSATERIRASLGDEIADKLVYRIHCFNEGYEVTGCGKRNYNALVAEGFTDKCVRTYVNEFGKVELTSAIVEKKSIKK